MFGLVIIAAFVIYVLVSILVIVLAIAKGPKLGGAGWIWGLGAALVMYNLVFWDYLPTLYAHKHYCEKEAGFWVYKTLDQWKAENPGVMETLVANKDATHQHENFDDGHGVSDTYFLNARFNWIVIKQDISGSLPIMRFEQQVKDVKTGEVFARYIDFATGNSIKDTVGPPGPLKFWLFNGHCSDGGSNQDSLRAYRNQFMGMKK